MPPLVLCTQPGLGGLLLLSRELEPQDRSPNLSIGLWQSSRPLTFPEVCAQEQADLPINVCAWAQPHMGPSDCDRNLQPPMHLGSLGLGLPRAPSRLLRNNFICWETLKGKDSW